MRARVGLATWVLAGMLLVSPRGATAQIGHFLLSGDLESEVGMDNLKTGSDKSRSSWWGGRLAPTLDGFILDPRLLTISLGGSVAFRDVDATTGDTTDLFLEPYRLNLTLFPYGLHSFNVRASRATSDTDLSLGEVSRHTDLLGVGWRYRGQGGWPEATVGLERETIDERFLEGDSGRTRTALTLRLTKPLERAQPTFTYTAEHIDNTGLANRRTGFEEEGLRHRFQYEDRILLGAQAALTPFATWEIGPDFQQGNLQLNLAGPLSPTADGSATARYSLSDLNSLTTQTFAMDGTLIKRFSPDLILTTIANGVYVASDSGDAWGAGFFGALSAVPHRYLRGVVDYGIQVASGDGTTFNHRFHLNAASTVLPRHVISADYFLALADVPGGHDFASHTGSLELTSYLFPRTTALAGYYLEIQQGSGDRQRHRGRVGADISPWPALLGRAYLNYITQHEGGGGRSSRDEEGVLAEAGVAVRGTDWLELALDGAYGVKDVDREDRSGWVDLYGVTGSMSVFLPSLFLRVEGFHARDDDVRQDRTGGRASLSYRFRVWTLTLEAEYYDQVSQGQKIGRERVMLRLGRSFSVGF